MIHEILSERGLRSTETAGGHEFRPLASPPFEKRLQGPNPAIKLALNEHYTNFRRYLLRRVGDQATADDILQNFCVRVLKPSAPLRNNDSAVAWLYVVLKSVLMDHFRRETTRRRLEANYAEQQVILGQDIVEDKTDGHQCGCIKPLIGGLRRDYAQILTRIDLHGETQKSAGEALKISPENLRVRLHRARRAVFKALKSKCGGCCATQHDDCYCE